MITIDQILIGCGLLLFLAAGLIEKIDNKKNKSVKIPYGNKKKYVEFIAFKIK